MKTEKGDRKLTVNKNTAWFLLAGLIAALVASGYFKLETAICVQAFGIYVGGLVGKDFAFVYGNRAEYLAPKPKPEETKP